MEIFPGKARISFPNQFDKVAVVLQYIFQWKFSNQGGTESFDQFRVSQAERQKSKLIHNEGMTEEIGV